MTGQWPAQHHCGELKARGDGATVRAHDEPHGSPKSNENRSFRRTEPGKGDAAPSITALILIVDISRKTAANFR